LGGRSWLSAGFYQLTDSSQKVFGGLLGVISLKNQDMIKLSLLFISIIIFQDMIAQNLHDIKGKLLVYQALFIEPNGDTLTVEKIECQFTSNLWIFKNQEEVKFTYFTDTIATKEFIHPFEKVRKKHERNQIKREQKKAGWENWTWLEKTVVTGYVLSDSVFSLHPPRENQYLYNEISGMPHVELNRLNVGGSWQIKTIIMMGWYDFKGTVESSYQVKGKESYESKGVSVPGAWVIEASHSHSRLGQYQSSILFDEQQHGFLRFDNSFHDGRRIILSLVEVKSTPHKG
jgi:hypothetical protein